MRPGRLGPGEYDLSQDDDEREREKRLLPPAPSLSLSLTRVGACLPLSRRGSFRRAPRGRGARARLKCPRRGRTYRSRAVVVVVMMARREAPSLSLSRREREGRARACGYRGGSEGAGVVCAVPQYERQRARSVLLLRSRSTVPSPLLLCPLLSPPSPLNSGARRRALSTSAPHTTPRSIRSSTHSHATSIYYHIETTV